jgi:hypothetical protein
MGAVSGVKAAPATPPENLSGEFPFSVCYPSEGTWTEAVQGMKEALHFIVIELHLQRGALPYDVAAALNFADSVPNALFSALSTRFSGTINTFGRIRYTFGAMEWGGIKTIGWRWTLEDVKIQSAVT